MIEGEKKSEYWKDVGAGALTAEFMWGSVYYNHRGDGKFNVKIPRGRLRKRFKAVGGLAPLEQVLPKDIADVFFSFTLDDESRQELLSKFNKSLRNKYGRNARSEFVDLDDIVRLEKGLMELENIRFIDALEALALSTYLSDASEPKLYMKESIIEVEVEDEDKDKDKNEMLYLEEATFSKKKAIGIIDGEIEILYAVTLKGGLYIGKGDVVEEEIEKDKKQAREVITKERIYPKDNNFYVFRSGLYAGTFDVRQEPFYDGLVEIKKDPRFGRRIGTVDIVATLNASEQKRDRPSLDSTSDLESINDLDSITDELLTELLATHVRRFIKLEEPLYLVVNEELIGYPELGGFMDKDDKIYFSSTSVEMDIRKETEYVLNEGVLYQYVLMDDKKRLIEIGEVDTLGTLQHAKKR
jgi:hypothetical protein